MKTTLKACIQARISELDNEDHMIRRGMEVGKRRAELLAAGQAEREKLQKALEFADKLSH